MSRIDKLSMNEILDKVSFNLKTDDLAFIAMSCKEIIEDLKSLIQLPIKNENEKRQANKIINIYKYRKLKLIFKIKNIDK